jgi:hypothetical protein
VLSRDMRYSVAKLRECPQRGGSLKVTMFFDLARLPMTEEPGEFLVPLVRDAHPTAERAGDIAR